MAENYCSQENAGDKCGLDCNLKNIIDERDKAIEGMHKTVEERDKTIKAIHKAMAEKDATIAFLNETIDEMKKIMAEMQNINKKMLSRLAIVDNPHKPTSHQLFKEMRKEQSAEENTGKRPGPPKGHPGTTDNRPVTHFARATIPACKKCGCKFVKLDHMHEELMTEVEIIKYKKMRLTNLAGHCVSCGEHVKGVFLLESIKPVANNNASDNDSASGNDNAPHSNHQDSQNGDKTVDVGNGTLQVVRSQDEKVDVGDVVEAEDTDKTLDLPESDNAPHSNHQDSQNGDKTVDVGNGTLQVVRSQDEKVDVGDVVEAEDTDKTLDLPESDNAPHSNHQDSQNGDKTVDVGNGTLQVVRSQDEKVDVGDVVEAEDTDKTLDLPESGRLGLNLLYTMLLEWRHRLTIRAIIDILKKLHKLSLSTATIWFTLDRLARGLKPEYDAILKRILASPYIHIDETSFYVKNVKKWVWILTTREDIYYFVDSRKVDRIKEILDGYTGIIIVDGYHTRKLFEPYLVQRCTVHMERDLKKWAKEEEMITPDQYILRNLKKAIRQIIWDARDTKKNGQGPEKYDEMCSRLDKELKYYQQYPDIIKKLNKIRNAGYSLFTFMKYSYVDSTNNLAERGMREPGKHRAVKSLLRSTRGSEIFAILLSISMTYKNDDLMVILKKYFSRYRDRPPPADDQTD